MDTLYLLQFTCFLFMLVNILILGITRLHMKWMNRRYEVSRWLICWHHDYVMGGNTGPILMITRCIISAWVISSGEGVSISASFSA